MRTLSLLKLQLLHGSIVSRVFNRVILFAIAMTIFPFLQLMRDNNPAMVLNLNSDACTQNLALESPSTNLGQFLSPFSGFAYSLFASPLGCKEYENVTISFFTELMDKKMLKADANALRIGEGSASAVSALGELGFVDPLRLNQNPISMFKRKSIVHGLDHNDNLFDFVFSTAPNTVSTSALFVIEIERILKPGGLGVILVVVPNLNPGSLMKYVTPISSFLRSSDVVLVSSIDLFSMIVFKKKVDIVNPFEHYKLPDECSSITSNKPFTENLEPLLEKELVEFEGRISYLPKFLDVSSRKRFIYIDVGAGRFLDSNTTTRFFDSYPMNARAFDVYVVDDDTSVLSSYVNKPRTTFVYHPGLSRNKDTSTSFNETDDWPPVLDDGAFDFLVWFRETVTEGDFVVLKMNAAEAEQKILHQLFESGAICHVDELFLRCPGDIDGQSGKLGECVNLFESLRSSGVFVHQWV